MYEQMDCSIIILKQMTGNAFWVLGRGIFKGFVKHMGFFPHKYVSGHTAACQRHLTHWICVYFTLIKVGQQQFLLERSKKITYLFFWYTLKTNISPSPEAKSNP